MEGTSAAWVAYKRAIWPCRVRSFLSGLPSFSLMMASPLDRPAVRARNSDGAFLAPLRKRMCVHTLMHYVCLAHFLCVAARSQSVCLSRNIPALLRHLVFFLLVWSHLTLPHTHSQSPNPSPSFPPSTGQEGYGDLYRKETPALAVAGG